MKIEISEIDHPDSDRKIPVVMAPPEMILDETANEYLRALLHWAMENGHVDSSRF